MGKSRVSCFLTHYQWESKPEFLLWRLVLVAAHTKQAAFIYLHVTNTCIDTPVLALSLTSSLLRKQQNDNKKLLPQNLASFLVWEMWNRLQVFVGVRVSYFVLSVEVLKSCPLNSSNHPRGWLSRGKKLNTELIHIADSYVAVVQRLRFAQIMDLEFSVKILWNQTAIFLL